MYLPPNVYFAEPESESDDRNVYSYWMKQNSLMVLHPLLLSLILPSLYIYLYSSLLFPPFLPSPLPLFPLLPLPLLSLFSPLSPPLLSLFFIALCRDECVAWVKALRHVTHPNNFGSHLLTHR